MTMNFGRLLIEARIIAASLAALAFWGSASWASDSRTQAQPEETPEWWFRNTSYAWVTAQQGDLLVGAFAVPVKVGFSDMLASLDEIDMAFQGGVELGRGRWSAGVDLTYGKLSDRFAGDGTTFRTLRMEQAAWMVNPFVSYRLAISGDWQVDALVGARLNRLELDLAGQLVAGGEQAVGGSRTWTDPIVGVRAKRVLSEKWTIGFRADVGGFDFASRLTWQGYAGIGWQVTKSMAAAAGYRALATDYSRSGFAYDTLTHGPLVELVVSF